MKKPFEVTKSLFDAFMRTKRGRGFNCVLCGVKFSVGDKARWLCANTRKATCGNFFVCAACDGPNDDVIAKAQASLEYATKLAKAWDIYGPDWQKDYLRFS